MKRIAALTLAIAALLVSPSSASDPEEQPPAGQAAKPAEVEMDHSFRIPQEGGEAISHTPAVVFTKDGKRMLTATSDGQLVVFEVGSRKVLRRIRLSESGSAAVSIDPSGRYAIWTDQNVGVSVLDIESGKVVVRDPKLKAKWVAVTPDGRRVAVAEGKTLQVRELATLKPQGSSFESDGEVTNVAWSPDSKLIGWTTASGQVVVRDPVSTEPLVQVKKASAMHAIAFRPNGTHVAYGGVDRQVYQYSFADKKEEVISKGQPFWITCLGYSPDGGRIAVGDESCDIWLYDVNAKKRLFHNKHHVECWLNSVAWAPDNETFLFGCRPNSHAGRPHLHMPLTRAEAARSKAARDSRRRLLDEIDAEIARAKGDKERTVLKNYRETLAREEQVQAYGSPFASTVIGLAGGAGGGTAGLTDAPVVNLEGVAQAHFQGAAAAAQLEDLPKHLRKLAEEHGKTVQKEMKRLQSDFCVNQWKVK
jgi:hypothetical protein